MLVRLADALPADIKVCIVADRGFGDHKLYRLLTEDSKEVATGAHATLPLDGAGYHAAADLTTSDTLTLLPLPSYSPKLNPMENV